MRKKLSLASGLLAALVSGGLWVSPQNSGAAAGFSYPSKVKEWTVMVYMNGKSDLEENDFENINNMETAGSSKEVNVVAEYARTRGQKNDFTGDGDWTGSRRYYIQKDIDSKKINSPVLAQFARPDMGDWRHLAAFIRWAKTNFPARRYMLVLRHHGGGWIDPRPSPKAMSYDDEMGTFIATVDMGNIPRGIPRGIREDVKSRCTSGLDPDLGLLFGVCVVVDLSNFFAGSSLSNRALFPRFGLRAETRESLAGRPVPGSTR